MRDIIYFRPDHDLFHEIYTSLQKVESTKFTLHKTFSIEDTILKLEETYSLLIIIGGGKLGKDHLQLQRFIREKNRNAYILFLINGKENKALEEELQRCNLQHFVYRQAGMAKIIKKIENINDKVEAPKLELGTNITGTLPVTITQINEVSCSIKGPVQLAPFQKIQLKSALLDKLDITDVHFLTIEEGEEENEGHNHHLESDSTEGIHNDEQSSKNTYINTINMVGLDEDTISKIRYLIWKKELPK